MPKVLIEMDAVQHSKRYKRLPKVWLYLGQRCKNGDNPEMTNERYRLLKIGDYISQTYGHNPALVIASPNERGKTDTIRIFLKENNTSAILPPASPSGLFDFFNERTYLTTVIIDDPSNWRSNDFITAIQFFKNVTSGVIDMPRKTKFQSIPSYIARMQVAIFCSIEQYNQIRGTLKLTGFNERAITIFTDHDLETKEYIFNIYSKYKNGTLPEFVDFCIIEREIDETEVNWIYRQFSGHKRKTVLLYAKLMTKDEFEELKPFLLSYKDMNVKNEKIKFKENSNKK